MTFAPAPARNQTDERSGPADGAMRVAVQAAMHRAGGGGGARRPLRIALVGNHPPRRCGIATYTRDVAAALRRAGHALFVVAMDDGSMPRPGPGVDVSVDVSSREAHRRAGLAVGAWDPDVVLIEHEYGIFGGPAGVWLLDMLESTDAPVVPTLHTVLEAPDAAQRRVLDGLLARSAGVVVMAERGRAMLRATHGGRHLPPVAVVPHGAPDLPRVDPATMRAERGWPERPTALTFGLIGPGKGIETMIEALPAVLGRVPEARYVLLGATHPHLVAREGERYRDTLRERARALGVKRALTMIDRYVDDAELLALLRAADVYVTPYPNPAQITSGTLAYAHALGLPIISTPYWHAAELLDADALVPFCDPAAMAARVGALLGDPTRREAAAARNYRRGRSTVWGVHAVALGDVLRAAVSRAAGRAVRHANDGYERATASVA